MTQPSRRIEEDSMRRIAVLVDEVQQLVNDLRETVRVAQLTMTGDGGPDGNPGRLR